ncbi:hypothetical protein D9M70_403710 [compost metagenome]
MKKGKVVESWIPLVTSSMVAEMAKTGGMVAVAVGATVLLVGGLAVLVSWVRLPTGVVVNLTRWVSLVKD